VNDFRYTIVEEGLQIFIHFFGSTLNVFEEDGGGNYLMESIIDFSLLEDSLKKDITIYSSLVNLTISTSLP